MPVSLEISDEVLSALKLPPRAIERELRKELAIHLVAEGLLPQGSACRLASMSRLAFELNAFVGFTEKPLTPQLVREIVREELAAHN